jgi:hypothetical protein
MNSHELDEGPKELKHARRAAQVKKIEQIPTQKILKTNPI